MFRFGTVLASDEMRLVILYKHGGFYFDMDVVFLNDMSGLAEKEFAYEWERMPYANNAILHMHQHSPKARTLIQKIVNTNDPYAPRLYAYDFLKQIGLDVLDCHLFDTGWFDDCSPELHMSRFFKTVQDPVNINEFSKGSYVYHWHNKWDHPIEPGSIAALLLERFSR
jgi:mannosyltransferase OCH1-like enzyme